jgi:hypothetical protein
MQCLFRFEVSKAAGESFSVRLTFEIELLCWEDFVEEAGRVLRGPFASPVPPETARPLSLANGPNSSTFLSAAAFSDNGRYVP